MPSARRQAVVVEVRPDDATSSASIAPSSPSSTSKAVRFPEKAEIIAGFTRPLTPTEAWSLYHFETHARVCSACDQPYHTLMNGGRLCDEGHSLAYDVIMHVYHRDGQIYSTISEKSRDVRVEIPRGYDQLTGLLKAMERRKRKQAKPTIKYETRSARAPAVQPVYYEEPYAYVSAPSRSRSHHKQSRYSTIIVGRDDDDYDNNKRSRSVTRDEKRGSLHKENVQPRSRKEYMIEVLVPEDQRRRRHKDFYH